jgi:mannose-1-phosphate guanylyltransferase
MPDRFALVLAGGRGERFWPWSRPERPKQLLPLARGGRTLLRATLDRIRPLLPPERCLVLTSRDLVAAVARECPEGMHVMGEPVGRNTAPAIGAAAHCFQSKSKDASFVVLPADHAIEDEAAFAADLEKAYRAAESSPVLVAFGIPPTHGHAGLGYVRRGTVLADRLVRVAAFTEKPSREKADAFVASGEYLWNAGIFVWKAGVFLDALRAGRPRMRRTGSKRRSTGSCPRASRSR